MSVHPSHFRREFALLPLALWVALPGLWAADLYSFGNPTAEEQSYIELINRARANPAAEGARLAATTDPDVLKAYTQYAVDLTMMRNEFNVMFESNKLPWIAYGEFSMVRVIPNYTGERPGDDERFIPFGGDLNALDGPKDAKLSHAIRQGMLLNGVDFWGTAGMTSMAHSAADVRQTVRAMG